MLGIDPSEYLLIAIVAIIVIGPKDLPMALRTAGRWIAKVRRVSNHFRSGIETMIREAEMEEMERKWREQNAAIMAATPAVDPHTIPVGEPLPQTVPQTQPAAMVEHHPVDPLVAAHAPTEPVMMPLAAPEPPAAPHGDHPA
jgi:sec-independent protein translocase protein TatB